MTDPNPWFPYFYAATYTKPFNRRTLSEELLLETVQRSNRESVRRIVGLQLFIFENYGLRLGWGTGWRVQPVSAPGHAAPGNSWHEGIPLDTKMNAFAIDTVGCDDNGNPRHGDVWTLQERHCEDFGLVSFRYLADRPHLQPDDIPRARSFRNSTSLLPDWPLPKHPIPARYDLDLIDIHNPLAPRTPSGPVHNPTPIGDDDMKFVAYYQLDGSPGIWAHYHNPGAVGVKVQMNDLTMWSQHARVLMSEGVAIPDEDDFGLIRTGDVAGFRALGPILGVPPVGCDTFGVPVI